MERTGREVSERDKLLGERRLPGPDDIIGRIHDPTEHGGEVGWSGG